MMFVDSLVRRRIELIRNCPLEVLNDKGKLSDLIKELGLKKSGEAGLEIWQNPDQLAEYLLRIGTLGIRKYVEIGTAAGGTFITTLEYLKRVSGPVTGIAIDPYVGPMVKYKWILDYYLAHNDNVSLIQEKSNKALTEVGYADLVFIDGCHKFPVVREDYLLSKNISKHVAFHDILGLHDVMAAWLILKQQDGNLFNFYEFTDIPENYPYEPKFMFGIGLAVRK